MDEARLARAAMSAEEILSTARALLSGERNLVANCANVASLLWHAVPRLNWAGFYLFDGSELVLGPFQGKPACTRIALRRGVCGTAAAERRTLAVPDVREFPGHIACDGDSRAELVAPLTRDGRLVGVLDLDSPETGRFGPADQALAEALAALIAAGSDLPSAKGDSR
jgi:L-methionine (R)-S-oxide reductase